MVVDDLATTPAIVMGRRMDILGWYRLAAAMITDFAKVAEKHRNYVRILFTNPAMRTLYADWESVARTAVAQLRMQAAKYPDDPRLAGLVEELSVRDPQFRTWWAARTVASLTTGSKTLIHPHNRRTGSRLGHPRRSQRHGTTARDLDRPTRQPTTTPYGSWPPGPTKPPLRDSISRRANHSVTSTAAPIDVLWPDPRVAHLTASLPRGL
ncbi:hypothetical protein [Micromonospora saelicesensis]|uniref:MmyB-like transcription regulator ligand binding domain-containing protein n=1 Tax=Micromonospora saelicesensis TaxID=285676 RepID=A0A1C4Z2X4_9ACTN|nr:hypothetical protein [Micromonospora saelicesensis]SCF27244.1 hypothetical protein GA0070561_4853 [Micromonospora saelicesensis]